ncbi:glycosyltransferase family 4 protein [Alteromonas sp. 009811495]|uniref:glycosyltransferase family 4 protein n=1 Tax=Alteromonas sp. 009811495 TaxID=3002962 RepID=UPI00237ED4BC|nr:glycosyltransferase family 4 protein [Alteromonas sp. 009811495]WDT86466.1 glycosyltransferase family 4 protein [Alteromonas sp. 009811495]
MSNSVLHIELGRHLYGGAKQVAYLIRALETNSVIEQHLLCTDDSDISKVRFNSCRVHPIAYKGEADFFCIKRMLDVVKSVNPSIIHVHSRRGADVWGAILAKITGIPAICTRRVDNPESKFAYYKYKQYDAVISISHGVQQVVSLHCEGVVHQDVIHSAIDIDEYSQGADRAWLNSTFDIPDEHLVIGNFAQYISRKGQADIILAMQDVIAQNPNVTCLLFGKGALQESYQALIDRHKLQNNVKLCGFSKDVAKILPSIDIVIHPSYTEGLGVILLQAGASKCAVIASPVGGIPEVIKHDETGLMVAPGDIDGIAETLLDLMDNSDKRTRLGNALFEHVCSKFSIEPMMKAYSELYFSLISQSPDTSLKHVVK